MAKQTKFGWDRFKDRAWCGLAHHAHPDRSDQERHYFWTEYRRGPCGNYLQYSQSHGPEGETWHACAYLMGPSVSGIRTVSLGYAWCHTREQCETFIEGSVNAYLEKVSMGIPEVTPPVHAVASHVYAANMPV